MSVIRDAVLPQDLPHKGEEEIISIAANSDGLRWALHGNSNVKYAPSCFWVTPHITAEDVELEPCTVLYQFLCSRALDFIFGRTDLSPNAMKASALDMTNRRKVPAISVYLLIENKKLEEYLSYMFKDISARLLRLHRNNFFPEDVLNGLSKAPFMSVDRLACLYAAKSDYSACPLLLINCGNSISYTGLDKDGKIVGGGACAGLNMRFRALYDFDDQEDVPSIGLDEYKKMFDDAAKEGKPLPLFSEDVEISIMANVTSEVTGHLRNLVRQFLSVAKKENVGPAVPNIPAHIVFYGPDGDFLCKFLLKDCPVGVNFEPGTLIPSEKDISIHSRTNLVTYGIQHLLENEEKKTSPPNPDEVLRERVLGLRGAMATTLTVNGISKPDTYRGTFVNVIPMKTFEEDMFEIVFDNDGEREILDLKGLYDALRLYQEIGEELPEWNSEDWVKAKRKLSTGVEKALVQNHAVIKERKEELDAVMEKEGSVSSLLGKQPKPLQRGRKRNRDEADPLNRDPKDYVGMRVAKYFPGEGTTEELYFGTIDYISVQEDDEILWHVLYDDDDSEDYDENEVKKYVKLYAEMKHRDPKL